MDEYIMNRLFFIYLETTEFEIFDKQLIMFIIM
jgi:hypothetical protein